ncbi:hypothetical protein GBF38_013926 [Nibea albiflora]|uniref:Uncharacterized protein n=1 Tax=Nibea albiflora TaxID=240163 RepID=A0ACB7F5S4_NIBAL|nr:hypothetical protein GBF38_013926 [Nibea albiflora]
MKESARKLQPEVVTLHCATEEKKGRDRSVPSGSWESLCSQHAEEAEGVRSCERLGDGVLSLALGGQLKLAFSAAPIEKAMPVNRAGSRPPSVFTVTVFVAVSVLNLSSQSLVAARGRTIHADALQGFLLKESFHLYPDDK